MFCRRRVYQALADKINCPVRDSEKGKNREVLPASSHAPWLSVVLQFHMIHICGCVRRSGGRQTRWDWGVTKQTKSGRRGAQQLEPNISRSGVIRDRTSTILTTRLFLLPAVAVSRLCGENYHVPDQADHGDRIDRVHSTRVTD